MAVNKKISQLPPLDAVVGDELVPVVRDGSNYVVRASLLRGQDGADGHDGLPGRDGVDGTNGKDGINGVDGRDGRDGRDGADGQTGAPGADAYQVAVANGFEGTRSEWLESLKAEVDTDSFATKSEVIGAVTALTSLIEKLAPAEPTPKRDVLIPETVKCVDFYDYDGTHLYSMTIEEAQALEEVPLPPEHDRLTFDGWNYTLEEINALTHPAVIGACYYTTSGHVEFEVEVGFDYSQDLGIALPLISNIIDWGDGTVETSSAPIVGHEYLAGGTYTIVLLGEMYEGDNSGADSRAIKRIAFPQSMTEVTEEFNQNTQYNTKVVHNAMTNLLGVSRNNTAAVQVCVISPRAMQELPPNGLTVYAYQQTGAYSFTRNFNLPDGFQTSAKLKSYVLPETSKRVFMWSLYDSGYVSDFLYLPEGIEEIGEYAFGGPCLKNTSYKIKTPHGIKRIDNNGFNGCGAVGEVELIGSIESIGNKAFEKCNNLEKVTILANNANMGTGVFQYCSNLKSARIEGVSSIPQNTFKWCTNLRDITIDGITSIGANAFDGCPITSFTIPSGVILESYALAGLRNLTEVTLPDTLTALPEGIFKNCGFVSFDIPGQIEEIGASAFEGCRNLVFLRLPSSMETVPSRLLAGTGFTSYTIPGTVHTLGEEMFEGCDKLTQVTLPESVTALPNRVFAGCGFTTFVIPDHILSIGNGVFSDCKNLTQMVIPNRFAQLPDELFSGCESLTDVTLPAGITALPAKIFKGCALESFDIPATVTFIGQYAFSGCNGLTTMTIPNSVTTIGSYAFKDCENLKSVTLPSGVTSINTGCFMNTGIESVEIPDSVTNIEENAFGFCPLTSIELPDGLSTLSGFAFRATNIAHLEIPEGVTNLPRITDMRQLVSLVIKSQNPTFGSNNPLTQSCDKLQSVTLLATTPPVINNYFDSKKNVNYYVPAQSLEAYKRATNWVRFADRIFAIPDNE